MCASPGGVATSLATQALLSAGTERHWMKSVPHLSSQDGPGRVQLEDFVPSRNRKVRRFESDLGLYSPSSRAIKQEKHIRVIRQWQPENLNSGR